MVRDTFTLGMISGTIGNLVKDLSNYVLYKRGFTTEIYHRVAGSLFLAPEVTERPMGHLVGQLTDIMLGAGLGVPIVYMLKLTGRDKYALKGMAAGIGGWLILYGLMGSGGLVNTRRSDPKTIFSGFLNNTLYGVATAYAAMKLGGPALERSRTGLETMKAGTKVPPGRNGVKFARVRRPDISRPADRPHGGARIAMSPRAGRS